jgi:hypothetical protein
VRRSYRVEDASATKLSSLADVLAHTPGVCFVDLDLSSAMIVVEFETNRVAEAAVAALLFGPDADTSTSR